MTVQESIIKHLRGRVKGRAIKAEAICRLVLDDTGIKIVPSEVRRCIAAIRGEAILPIASDSVRGYWEAQDNAEILAVIDRLNNRVANQLKSVKGLTDYLRNQTNPLPL